MISRRYVIGCGIAASALGVASRLGYVVESPTRPRPPVALLIVDERYDVARSLARSLADPSVPRVGLTRDVLDLWHRHLAPVCLAGTQAIAGVTTERGFFLLRTLAADHRLRVLWANALAVRRAGQEPLVSWMLGPK